MLEFDDRGLLTPGIHDATVEEVSEHLGRFQRTDRRMKLVQRILEYLKELVSGGDALYVLLDGSFVMTSIDTPEDIDIVVVLPADWDLGVELKPFRYNPISKSWVKRTFRFDVVVAKSGSEKEATGIDFFGQVNPKWIEAFSWPTELRKGLVRVML